MDWVVEGAALVGLLAVPEEWVEPDLAMEVASVEAEAKIAELARAERAVAKAAAVVAVLPDRVVDDSRTQCSRRVH